MKPWMLAAVGAAVLAGAPVMAHAQTQTGTQTQSPKAHADNAKLAEAWLAALVAWSSQTQGLSGRATSQLVAVTEGANVVLEMETRKQKAAAKKWLAEWGPARRAEIAQLRGEAAAIPPVPTLPAFISEDPRHQSKAKAFENLDGSLKAMISDTVDQSEIILTHIERAVAGDEQARTTIAGASVTAMIAGIRSENAFISFSRGVSGEDHPQGHLLSAMHSSNLGIISYLEYLLALNQGEEVDGQRYAASVTQHALAAAAAAQSSKDQAAILLQKLKADGPNPDGGMISRLPEAMALYDDSAAVEFEVAALLKTLAGHIAKGDITSPAFTKATEDLETLGDKRTELDRRRRAILTGGGRPG